jgi:hypothetical protein
MLSPRMPSSAKYDIFLSHAWADGEHPRQIADALKAAGLSVWFDANEIADFASITNAVTEGLAQSKALLAYYSKTYPLRRACQWELTAAYLAAQSEGDPRCRVLVINPEPQADHVHPAELRDASFLSAPSDRASMDACVEAIVKHVTALDGPLTEIQPLNPPQWFGNTPVGSTRFVGRLSEMWQIHSLLNAGKVTQVTGAPVLKGGIGQVSGLGGVGKSLLTEEYAIRFGAAYPGGVFWLRAYGNDDAKAALGPEAREAERIGQIQTIAERRGISTQGLSMAQIEGALAREIEQRGKPCLWVVDDIPDGLQAEALRRWFAPHPLARTLISTRSREYTALAESIDLSVLAPDEGYELLTSRKQPVGDTEQQRARELAQQLGYHALALDVAGSALASYGSDPYRKFREELSAQDKDALDLAAELSDTLPNGHEPSIARTMLHSVRSLGAEGLDLLRLASVLAFAPIPADLIASTFEAADRVAYSKAEQRQRKAFDEVTKASLADVAGQTQNSRLVHTLVSRTVRFAERRHDLHQRLPELLALFLPKRSLVLQQKAVRVIADVIQKAADDPRLHKQIELYVAHARHLARHVGGTGKARLLGYLGLYDDVRGDYVSAQALHAEELALRVQIQGEEHPDTLTARGNLGLALIKKGDFAAARKATSLPRGSSRRRLGLGCEGCWARSIRTR